MKRIGYVLPLCLTLLAEPADAQAVAMVGKAHGTEEDKVKTFTRTPDGDWRSIVVGPDGVKREYVYVPGTKVEPRVEVSLSLASGSLPVVTYRYTVANGAGARQGLARFFLIAAQPVTARDVPSVWYWQTPPSTAGLIFAGNIVGDRMTGIPPGEVVEGPVVEGPVLPGVIRARTMGNPPRVQAPPGLSQEQRDDLLVLSKPGFVDIPVIGPAITMGAREPDMDFDLVLIKVGTHYAAEMEKADHPDTALVKTIFAQIAKEGASVADSGVRKGLENILALRADRSTDPWQRQLSEALTICARALLSGGVPVKGYPME